jgi:hypothetical protein
MDIPVQIVVTVAGGVVVLILGEFLLQWLEGLGVVSHSRRITSILRAAWIRTTPRPDRAIKYCRTAARDASLRQPGYKWMFSFRLALWRRAEDITDAAVKWESDDHPFQDLEPNPEIPLTLVIGKSGSGKTSVAREQFQSLAQADYRLTVYLDLRRFADRERAGYRTREKALAARSDAIFESAAVPDRLDRRILAAVAQRTGVLFIIDGLNEVSVAAQDAIVREIERMGGADGRRCLAVVYSRPSDFSKWPTRRRVFSVEPLSVGQVRRLYDATHTGGDAWVALPAAVQDQLREPFFLDLAMRGGVIIVGEWMPVTLGHFLKDVVSLDTTGVRQVADAYMARSEGSSSAAIRSACGPAISDALIQAGVLGNDGDISHDNWRNFLSAVFLAASDDRWTYEKLDSTSVYGQQPDAIVYTLAIVEPAERKAEFLKKVYDWNYGVAALCAGSAAAAATPGSANLAVLTLVAVKRFDKFASTAARATRLLKTAENPLAGRLAEAPDYDCVIELAAAEAGDEVWVRHWLHLLQGDVSTLTKEEWAEEVSDRDGLIGWTAANRARLVGLSTHSQAELRRRFSVSTAQGDEVVRWRIVHALGAYATNTNLGFLIRAIEDHDHWVRYGAVRSLLEIAADGTALRTEAIAALRNVAVRLRPSERPVDAELARMLRSGATLHGETWRAVWLSVLEETGLA